MILNVLSDAEPCGALSAVTFGVNWWLRVRIAQSMNDRHKLIVEKCEDVLGRIAGSASLSAPLPENLVFVVYVWSRLRLLRISCESSDAPRVRSASMFVVAVGMSQFHSVCTDADHGGTTWLALASHCNPISSACDPINPKYKAS